MAGLIAYSGITTKVKAMKVRLMSGEDYEKIVNLDGVSEFISFLRQNSNYLKIFGNVDEQNIHRGQIEHVLINALYGDYEKIYRFSNNKQRKILSLLFFRFEMNVLKDCIMSVYHEEDELKEFLYMDFFRKHSDLPIDRMKGLSNMEDLLQSLKGTKYYNTVLAVFNQPEATLFDYETQLDIFYYKNVWKLKDKILRGDELRSYTDVMGHQIDLLNILWIYRFKLFYAVDVLRIYASIIPIHYKLTNRQLSDMVESANVEDFLAILKNSHYRRYLTENDAVDFELLYLTIVRDIYKKHTKRYPNSISPIHEFLYLKEREIDKLTTALECIRYQMNPEESLALLKE